MSNPKRSFFRDPWIIGTIIVVVIGICFLTTIFPMIVATGIYLVQSQTTASATGTATAAVVSTQIPSIVPSPTPTAAPTPTATLPPPAVDQSYVLGNGVISDVSFSPDKKLLAVGTMQETVIYDSASMQELWRFDHQGPIRQINTMTWSPDSSRLAVDYFYDFEKSRTVIWNIVNRQEELTFLDQNYGAETLAWSPDGKQLASISNNAFGQVVVWDVQSGKVLYGPVANSSDFITWTDDGRLLLYSTPDGKIVVLDAETFAVLRSQGGNTISLSSRYHWVASARMGKTSSQIIVWDPATGKVVHTIDGLTFPSQPKKDVARWSPDGTKLIIAIGNKPLTLVVVSSEAFTQIQLTKTATNAVWSADGTQIATWDWYGLKSIEIWNANGSHRKSLSLPDNFLVFDLQWAPDSTSVVATDVQRGPALSWDINTSERTMFIPGYTGAQQTAAWSPYGQVLASGWQYGPVFLWNLNTGVVDKIVYPGSSGIMAMAFNPDGSRLAVHGTDNSVSILDPTTGQLLNRMEGDNVKIPYDYTSFEGLAWSPDGKLLAAGFVKHLVVWDGTTGERRMTIPTPDADYPDDLSISPDNTQLVYRSWDKLVVVSMQTGEHMRTLDGVLGVSWTSSGALRLLSQIGNQAMAWDPASDLPISGTAPLSGKISPGAFSPDGKYFAEVRTVTGRESQMIVWNIIDGTSISSLPFLSGADNPHVAWSTDSTQVAVPSFDGRIVILKVNG